ncbi:hypothetical protein Ddye_028310 [Dipteronia dyeriana]|uniref:Retrovirus-related Pol polyprotein from transposon RE2 n=1 Tax=Dipteronia dyeriana TaxID=168575 RepID=A0AAD9WS82_9ROSI|nr:hypothetical protein Ddye_028310 [Dipteronia dyeriana]
MSVVFVDMLGRPLDSKDLNEKVLDGLDDDYLPLIDAINGWETTIPFGELHEKLITKELLLTQSRATSVSLTATVNPAGPRTRPWCFPSQSFRSPATGTQSSSSHGSRPPSKPYLKFFQACNTQGHTAKHCPSFNLVASQSQNTQPPQQPWHPHHPSSWQPQPLAHQMPRAHYADAENNGTPTWLLDSCASHLVTSDLNNVSLHSPYTGSYDIVIGDGTELPIRHRFHLFISSHS